MARIFILLISMILTASFAFSQAEKGMGGGPGPDFQNNGPCLEPQQRQAIFDQIKGNRKELIEAGILSAEPTDDIVSLEWPLRQNSSFDDYGYHGLSNYFDHNSGSPNQITDYNCGSRSYDTQNGYNHQGTDYYLWPFRWYKMDNDVVEVVAAAAGTIVSKTDGNYDRSCDFNNNSWNAVYIQHSDNSTAWYGHLKNGSITSKIVGQTVVAGEYLGVVGSSGNSTGPHLHLELYDENHNLIDPYSGSCNNLNTSSWWADQHDYYNSGVNALITQSAPPDFGTCPAQEIRNEKDFFDPGDKVYLVTYYRDHLSTQTSTYTIYQPDGGVWDTWTHNMNATFYSSSYWYWWRTLPFGKDGLWKFKVVFEGETYETTFNVGIAAGVEKDIFPDHIKVFPNPTNKVLNISFEEIGYKRGEISLTNSIGQSVYQKQVSATPVGSKLEIPVRDMSPGVYILLAELDGKVFRKKIMVE